MDLDGKDSRQLEPTTHLVPKSLLSLNPGDTPRIILLRALITESKICLTTVEGIMVISSFSLTTGQLAKRHRKILCL